MSLALIHVPRKVSTLLQGTILKYVQECIPCVPTSREHRVDVYHAGIPDCNYSSGVSSADGQGDKTAATPGAVTQCR